MTVNDLLITLISVRKNSLSAYYIWAVASISLAVRKSNRARGGHSGFSGGEQDTEATKDLIALPKMAEKLAI